MAGINHPLHTERSRSKPGRNPHDLADIAAMKSGGQYNPTDPATAKSSGDLSRHVRSVVNELKRLDKDPSVSKEAFDDAVERAIEEIKNPVAEPGVDLDETELGNAAQMIADHAKAIEFKRAHAKRENVENDVGDEATFPLYKPSQKATPKKQNNWAKWDAAHPKR